MHRLLSGGLLSAAVALGLASAAGAQPVIHRTGNTYYTAVCPDQVGLYAHCNAKVVTDKFGHPITSAQPPISGLAPADLRDAYKITGNGKSSTIIAIVDAFGYDNAERDLNVYREQFGLGDCTTDNGCFKKLNQKGQRKNYPAFNLGWAQESALDLDMASAMCPNCQIWLIEAKRNNLANLAAAVAKAAELGAHVISNSYGGGEGERTLAFEPYYDHPGVAVTASTGDGGFGVQAPADMPSVIAVGGTALTRDGSDRGWHETVWSGAGSGCSKVFTKPSWQLDTGCKGRTIGDVAADASPGTGVAAYVPVSESTSGWRVFGGTSVAAPLVGGIFGNNGGKVDSASTLYAHTSALFDVTTGSNGSCGNGPLGLGKRKYLCTGEVGYDGPTGNGTPNGTAAFGD